MTTASTKPSVLDAAVLPIATPTPGMQVSWSKNSMGCHFGFKLHLTSNERGEWLTFKLTSANINDRVLVVEMTLDLIDQLFGERGYIGKDFFEALYERRLELLSNNKKKHNKLVKLVDKVLLCKHALIETVNDPIKNSDPIEYFRHRSPYNFLFSTLTALVAYAYHEKRSFWSCSAKAYLLPRASF